MLCTLSGTFLSTGQAVRGRIQVLGVYLIWAHRHAQVQQAPRLHETGYPPDIPNVSPGVHRIPIPAQAIVLIAREGDCKLEFGQVAVEPRLCQAPRREGPDLVVLRVDFLVLHRQQLFDACEQCFVRQAGLARVMLVQVGSHTVSVDQSPLLAHNFSL